MTGSGSGVAPTSPTDSPGPGGVDEVRALRDALAQVIADLRHEVIAASEGTGRPPAGALAADLQRLDQMLGRARSTVSLAPLLVVEDDLVSVELLRTHLDLIGLANPVVVVGTGDEALERLQAWFGVEEQPALVLLDGHLPGRRDGLSVLRWMREQPALADTPVVMLTGESRVEWISEAYGLGIASYLVKPVGLEALAGVIRGLPRRWALLDR